MVAAALLAVLGYQNIFVGTVVRFIGSASLVAVSTLPCIEPPPASPFVDRLTSGARQFWSCSGSRPAAAILAVLGVMGLVMTRVAWRGEPRRASADSPSARR